tara:strand:+ start:92 stop:439 length:348 start_codon:yes stop_codon:yes gene_type:complete
MINVAPSDTTVKSGDVFKITDKIDLGKEVEMRRGNYLVTETESVVAGDITAKKVTCISYGGHKQIRIEKQTAYTFYQVDADEAPADPADDGLTFLPKLKVIGYMNKEAVVTFTGE